MSPDAAADVRALIEQGAIVQAIEMARAALHALAGEERAHVLLELATACNSGGDYIDALRAAVSATDLFKASDSQGGVCDALTRVAGALRSAGDHASAISTLEQAEQIARALGEPLRLAQVLRNIGVCSSLVGRHQHALSCLNEAIAELQALLAEYRVRGMRPNEGLCFAELGHCHEALSEAAAARDNYRQAIAILEDGGTLDDLQSALEGLSLVEEALGDHAASLAALRRVRAIDKRKSDEAARSAVVQRELRIELARLTSQWAQQATQDPLTGLGNRRALERWMDERLPRVEHGEPLTLLLLDLDHFKRVNDRFGHGVGDEVLKRVARVIQQCCRHRDLAVRYGGEEFVLAMASVDHPAAVAIAHRVRESVAALPWTEVAAGLAVSVSIGLAEARETFDAPALLTLADKRLYAAKYAGRNQVVAFG